MPFIGVLGCVFVMFLIQPLFSLVAIILVLGLYLYLSRRRLVILDTDVRSGLSATVAEWGVKRTREMQAAPERTWKPVILVPVKSADTLSGSYLFLRSMASPKGTVQTLGIYPPGEKEKLKGLRMLARAFRDDGIYAEATLLEEEDFVNGVRVTTQVLRNTFFRPNILFLHLRPDSDLDELQQLVDKTAAYQMGIALLARHPVVELGREQVINVWVSNQGPDWQHDLRQSNMDLALLLAYQLAQNWDGHINLCMAVPDEQTKGRAETFLRELIDLARLPKNTEIIVSIAPFLDALGQTPRGDLSIFGLAKEPDLTSLQNLVQQVHGSCVFIRDSGIESILA